MTQQPLKLEINKRSFGKPFHFRNFFGEGFIKFKNDQILFYKMTIDFSDNQANYQVKYPHFINFNPHLELPLLQRKCL